MESALSSCCLCPRRCKAARGAGSTGICGQGAKARVARAALHHWEEPPISGTAGSGTVFFSGCPLHCVYCQNAAISQGASGKEVSVERLAQIFLEQQARGALNINLVTPTQFAPQIVQAVELARSGEVSPRTDVLESIWGDPSRFPFARHELAALDLPIVYNTSGYETCETIALLEGTVDVFLTDFKYADTGLARRYSAAPDYPAVASRALDAMHELVPESTMGDDGRMTRGIIVRHLMLPGCLDDSMAVLDIVAGKSYANGLWVSLMNQYTPLPAVRSECPELDEHVSEAEYGLLVDYALNLGLKNSFMQEEGTDSASFIPSFGCEGV